LTVPLPVPVLPPVMVIQVAELVAVQAQPALVETVTLPLPLEALKEAEGGLLIENTHELCAT